MLAPTAGSNQIIITNAGAYTGGELWATTTGAISGAQPSTSGLFGFRFGLSFKTAVATEAGPSGERVAIGSALPNPVTGVSRVPFTLEAASDAKMTVYDVLGREVATLADGTYVAGTHNVAFDSAALTSGSYVVRLVANGTVVTRTLSVAR